MCSTRACINLRGNVTYCIEAGLPRKASGTIYELTIASLVFVFNNIVNITSNNIYTHTGSNCSMVQAAEQGFLEKLIILISEKHNHKNNGTECGILYMERNRGRFESLQKENRLGIKNDWCLKIFRAERSGQMKECIMRHRRGSQC